MGIHDRGVKLMCRLQCALELAQARPSDAGERGAERQEPGCVCNDAEAVTVKGGSNCFGINSIGVGSRWFQGEIHEVETVLTDPLDFLKGISGWVVHDTDFH